MRRPDRKFYTTGISQPLFRLLALLTLGLSTACAAPEQTNGENGDRDHRREEREAMVRHQIEGRGVSDPATLEAMRSVPRHRFVPGHEQDKAYADHPLPIGHGQTISQPYIVAAMTELLRLSPDDRVFEVGTGSGYQAAVLAEIVAEVYSIEIVEPLGLQAKERLAELGYDNVQVKVGDGYLGWPEHAPFDAIIVTCAPDHVPEPLVEQLKPGGRLCIPVGDFGDQNLYVLTKQENGELKTDLIFPVRFVPLVRQSP